MAIGLEAVTALSSAVGVVLEQGPQPEAWYKIITGIIAIPAGLLGLLLTYNILRKTTLESRKLELEIQSRVSDAGSSSGRKPSELLGLPTAQIQRALLLVLRFVILELTLRLWNFVPSAVGYLTTGALYTFFFIKSDRLSSNPRSAMALAAVPEAIRLGFDVVYWLMVFGFGWPLLKDTCSLLGIEVRSLIDLPGIRRWQRTGRTTNAS